MKAKEIKVDGFYVYTKNGQRTRVRVGGPACTWQGKSAWYVFVPGYSEGIIATSRELSPLTQSETAAQQMAKIVQFVDGVS